MKGKRKIKLQAEIISPDTGFQEAFNTMMNFEKWDSDYVDHWIDMVSVHNSSNPALARFASDETEMYFIEVHNSRALKRKQLIKLANKVRRINKRCTEKINTPLISLILM